MSNAIDLLRTTQQEFVSDKTLGTSESVVYTHKESSLVEDINVFVSDSTFNKKEKRTRGDYKTFTNVFLAQVPRVDDTILYDGLTYKVEDWNKQTGMYTIHAQHNKRQVGRTKRRM